jgi:hypothetical protein
MSLTEAVAKAAILQRAYAPRKQRHSGLPVFDYRKSPPEIVGLDRRPDKIQEYRGWPKALRSYCKRYRG